MPELWRRKSTKFTYSYRSSYKTRLGSKIASRRLLRQWPPSRPRLQILNKLLGVLWLAPLLWKKMKPLVPVAQIQQDLGTCSDIVMAPQPLGPSGPMAMGRLMTVEIQCVDLILSQPPKMSMHEVPSYYSSRVSSTTLELRSGSGVSASGGGPGHALCGPPLRRSSEHGGSAVRAALAASQSGSSARCGASLVWHTRAQRHRLRRKRRAFMWGARGANGPPVLWSHLQTVDESPAIKHVDPTPAVTPYAAPETAIRLVVPVSAVTYTSRSPVVEYVAPTPDAALDETAPAIEHMALALDDTFAAPAPVTQYVAPAPSDTDTTPESMIEFVAPAPCPLCDTSSTDRICNALTCDRVQRTCTISDLFTPSPQLPLAYTMSDIITGAIVATARSVNSQSPITDVGAYASQVAGSLPHADHACSRPRERASSLFFPVPPVHLGA